MTPGWEGGVAQQGHPAWCCRLCAVGRRAQGRTGTLLAAITKAVFHGFIWFLRNGFITPSRELYCPVYGYTGQLQFCSDVIKKSCLKMFSFTLFHFVVFPSPFPQISRAESTLLYVETLVKLFSFKIVRKSEYFTCTKSSIFFFNAFDLYTK